LTFTGLHGVIYQKIELFLSDAVRTSDFTPRNKVVVFLDVMLCTSVSEEPAVSISVLEDLSVLKMEAVVSSEILVRIYKICGITF
jgi:hypothetical protein